MSGIEEKQVIIVVDDEPDSIAAGWGCSGPNRWGDSRHKGEATVEARKTLTEMIDSLTEEIEHLWGKNNEGRNPSLLTDEKRRLKAALVKEKRSLVEQRWQQVPKGAAKEALARGNNSLMQWQRKLLGS